MKKLLARAVRARTPLALVEARTPPEITETSPPAVAPIAGIRFSDELPKSQEELYAENAVKIVATLKTQPGRWVKLYDFPTARQSKLDRLGVESKNIDGRVWVRWPADACADS